MNIKNSRRTMVMLGAIACLLLALSGTASVSTAADSVLYVKPSATGTGDCSDWANACTLQTALGVATAGDEIWVAEGTHQPTDGTDRTATFQMKNGVALYGGFAGTETSRDQRDWTLHETILSGDIGTVGDNGDNSYHVVTGSGTDASAILDGFTITGGNADGTYPNNGGGGMYNLYDSNPTLTNVTFSGNSANWYGGGMYNRGSSPALTSVTFSGNSAIAGGGGMFNEYSSPMLVNVTFSGNSTEYGGGMFNYESSPTLVNVTFSGNSAEYDGGGINNGHSSPTLVNVTFNGNSANRGGGMWNFNSSPTLVNVTFSGNSASWCGGGICNWYNSTSTLTNCVLWDNTASAGVQIYNEDSTPTISYSLVKGSGGSGPSWDPGLGTDGGGNIDANPQFVDAANGDLHLQATSPAIDAGDNDALPADTLDLDGDGDTAEKLPFDLDGNPRIVNGTVDMGAYEAQEVQLEVSIDIKPGSCPNPFNTKSKGVLPVAVLGTEGFDVTTIDPATIQLTREGVGEGVSPLRWSYEDVAMPFEGELCDCHELGGDGYMDLTLKFDAQEVKVTLDLEGEAGNTIPLLITGNLKEEAEGTPIEGSDCVWVLKTGKK